MAIKLNKTGYSHALDLIEQGKIDFDGDWSFTTEDENKILGDNNWSEYKKWFLAIDDEANEDTKAHYKYPFGKNGKVYRRGVIAAKQRAAQQKEADIEKAADNLLQKIDEKNENKKSENTQKRMPPVGLVENRHFALETRGVVDDENKVVEISFSSEAPVKRWFGTEILLHGDDNVDLKPFLEAGSVLFNHNPDNIVAKPIKAWVDSSDKKGRATIQFGNTEEARKAYEQVKEGLLRGVSVGYAVDEWRYISEDEVWNNIRGEAYVATKWRAIEVSLTPIPADSSVGVGRNIETDRKGGVDMEQATQKTEERKEQKIDEEILKAKKEAEKAERERIREIEAICETFGYLDLKDKFVDEGTSVDEVRRIVSERKKNEEEYRSVGVSGNTMFYGESAVEKFRDAAITGLLVRIGSESADKANLYTGMSLFEIARKALEIEHKSVVGSRKDIVARAMQTSSDFPIILQNVAHKSVLKGFESVSSTWKEWCDVGSVGDYNIHTITRVGEIDDLEEIREGEEYPYAGKIPERQEKYKIAKYGKRFAITREAILKDDLSVLSDIPKRRGEAAARKINEIAYKVLIENQRMGDGKPLFCTAHANIASTGSEPTTVEAIKAAYTAMTLQKDMSGKRTLNITPKFIIVPAKYKFDVKSIIEERYLNFSEGKPNPIYNELKLVSDSILDDAGNAWYLAADKGKTVRIFFLDGNQQPTLEN